MGVGGPVLPSGPPLSWAGCGCLPGLGCGPAERQTSRVLVLLVTVSSGTADFPLRGAIFCGIAPERRFSLRFLLLGGPPSCLVCNISVAFPP